MVVGSDDDDVDDANIENADVEEAIAEAEADTNNNNDVGLDKVDVLHSLDFIPLSSNCLGHFKVLKFKE
ncbi:5018_t:CDS:2 [Cetraspora pellucida]|uniref:5018_t:CDS:1 n=1 Tax=Cetraspora pellucida TaxID=1433469 RepID=A0ACA9NFK1_9GLOM|nr:5018_t:CDS:2 [Cetraspora pellucida]